MPEDKFNVKREETVQEIYIIKSWMQNLINDLFSKGAPKSVNNVSALT